MSEFKKVKTAIFPVAGYGTRFLPATKSQPKEMLPIVDKPVIHYLVEEAVNAGIEKIIIITGRGKRAIEDYFDTSFELEHNLVERGKDHLLKQVIDIPNLAQFIYIRQPIPKGDGDAILQAAGILNDEPVAVMFGDDLVINNKSALSQLIDVYEATGSSVIGLKEVPDDHLHMYGVVGGDLNGTQVNIKEFVEKPKTKEEAPSNLSVIGKYIVTPEVLSELMSYADSHDTNAEVRLADGFKLAINNGVEVLGIAVQGRHYDTGNKLGWLQANIDFALDRDDLGEDLKEFLSSK
jgi:UTP--glucose-1-phosphate uridylyltransferase